MSFESHSKCLRCTESVVIGKKQVHDVKTLAGGCHPLFQGPQQHVVHL